ncbi:MAG: hypothetical protein AAB401_10525 [Acidobacteriota bacterium]
MKRTADNTNFWSNVGQNIARFAVLALLAVALTYSVSAQSEPLTGVRNSSGFRQLNEKQLQQVRESLGRKSGFTELNFDRQGALTLGNRPQVSGGSATARALLIAAVDSQNLYELENHDHSADVAFARIYESGDHLIGATGKRMTIFQVQIDFADFNQLGGDREAKASFDIGIALLHELVHGVLKLQDPQDANQIGDCDAHINQMRRELQLPERLYYHPGITVAQIGDGRRIVSARLEFVGRKAEQTVKYQLSWLPANVSPNARNIAQLQQGLAMARRR